MNKSGCFARRGLCLTRGALPLRGIAHLLDVSPTAAFR